MASTAPQTSELIKNLLGYLDKSITAYHASMAVEKILEGAGFQRLTEERDWVLVPGEKYYVTRGESAVIAWCMGNGNMPGVRMIGAHTDSPGLHLKPNAVYQNQGYVQLGVEIYGGPLLASWTDRDLSLAGRVIVKADGALTTIPLRIERPILRVPQLAIHLNREVNNTGLLLNKQSHMPPILALDTDSGDPMDNELLRKLLAEELKMDVNDIVNWQLECYDTQQASLWGANNEFISSGRIDNITMCHAALQAITDLSDTCPQTAMITLFDNEEIGSGTRKGAASAFIRQITERILHTENEPHAVQRGLAESFCISADGAHAVHPNYAEYHDPQHAVKMNQGPVIKINANHRYASNAFTSSVFELLASEVNVPIQKYIHKTDLPCGSTIGPITEAGLGIPVVDVGNAMLAMHSIRETCGTEDHAMMIEVMKQFFRKKNLKSVER